MSLHLKRAYDTPSSDDGFRILVDRLWPRGLTKEKAAIDLWLREIAPSHELRKWFHHEPDKWPEFRERYIAELSGKPELIAEIADRAQAGVVTLVFSARDEEHNQAVVLREYIEGARA
jgi:uncharacterized protein YeaO (DUF488 family)